MYSKTPQSADFGTEQNTADCEIRRLRVLLYVVNGTEQCIRGHSKTTLTKICPILPTYLPIVDICWHLNYYLPNVNVDNWNTTPPPNMYLIFLCRLFFRFKMLKFVLSLFSKPLKSSHEQEDIIIFNATLLLSNGSGWSELKNLKEFFEKGLLKMSTLTLVDPCTHLQLKFVDIWSSTYLPRLVNVVFECPLIQTDRSEL